jgi:Fe-S cluster biogenesis protein NfuA
MKSVILFDSTNLALWAEETLKQNDIAAKMISVPRNISSDCGYCIMIDSTLKQQAEKLLQKHGINYNRIEDLKDV